MSVAPKMREGTVSVTREHTFLSRNRDNLRVKEFRRGSTPPVREKIRVDTRDKMRETTTDCRGHD